MSFSALWAASPGQGAVPSQGDESRKWRNHLRANAARRVALENKKTRRVQAESHRDDDIRQNLVHDFFTGYFVHLSRTVHGARQYLLDAARCTQSYVMAVQTALHSEIQGCTALVNIHSMDDLSKKFRCRYAHSQVVSGMRVCDKKFHGTVCTVFTNVQRVVFLRGDQGDLAHEWEVACPSTKLNGSKTQHIFNAFRRWALLSSANQDCSYLHGDGLAAMKQVKVKIEVLGTDGLTCNFKIAAREQENAATLNMAPGRTTTLSVAQGACT
jgi:hypothetical protein